MARLDSGTITILSHAVDRKPESAIARLFAADAVSYAEDRSYFPVFTWNTTNAVLIAGNFYVYESLCYVYEIRLFGSPRPILVISAVWAAG